MGSSHNNSSHVRFLKNKQQHVSTTKLLFHVNIDRSAAQCNKGFDVLYSVGVEHFIQVAVQIRRGPSLADRNLESIHSILHCQICEEWVKIPNRRAPLGRYL